MKSPSILRIVYQFGRLGVFAATLLPYLSWRTWRAKSYFRRELLKNGVPKELASSLADRYDKGNKNILKSVLRIRR